MDYVFYRKRDRAIVGYVKERRTNEATSAAINVELENICESELGGTPEDYGVTETVQYRQPLMVARINDRLEVDHVPAENPSLASAIGKLKRLGFSEREINALTK